MTTTIDQFSSKQTLEHPLTYSNDLPPSYASIITSEQITQSQSCQSPRTAHQTFSPASANEQILPSTPFNNRRRKHTEHESLGNSQYEEVIREHLHTPTQRDNLRESQDEPALSLLKASNPALRCSPSKRGQPFSSSSPPRQSPRETVLRARPDSHRSSRNRARTSSGTTHITESLASATVQCDSDVENHSKASSQQTQFPIKAAVRVTASQDIAPSLGASTLQVMKMGLSKYTPLLKPQWLSSESWKSESVESKNKPSSEPELPQRGHRRSKASESITQDDFSEVILHQKAPGSVASFIDSPPLTAKEDVKILTPVSTPERVLFSPSLLGPAFAEETRSSSILSAEAVRRPIAARATKGRSIHSYQTLTEVADSPSNRGALSSKRCRRLPFASLSNISQIQTRSSSVCLSPHDIVVSPKDVVGGLGIVCVQDDYSSLPNPQSPISSLVNRQDNTESLASTPRSINSPTCSTSSSVPSIVVTPPAMLTALCSQERDQRVRCEGVHLDFSLIDSPCTSDSIDPTASTIDHLPVIPLGNPISLLSSPSPPPLLETCPSPNEQACLLRSKEDDCGLSTYKAAVDAILSDYFIYRTVTRTWRLASQLVILVQSILSPNASNMMRAKVSHSKCQPSSSAPWNQDYTSSVVIPSLRGQRWIGEGDTAVKVPAQWGIIKLQTTLKLVLDHIVTGMVALVTDDRAPYETPLALGHLCRSLQEELPTFLKPPEDLLAQKQTHNAPESPVTSWVKACASVESPDSFQSSNTSGSLDNICDMDELEWRQALQSINPKAVFMECLHGNIQTTFEKGEAVRSKANLLAVPPPRKGSRKKWQAANAEINAQKALREKELSQVSCGVITVSEFRKRERKRAAVGNVKDNFAVFFFVRFVGELYNAKVLEVAVIRQWLQRFFFKTVFPGVPSSYELEAGCALLITVGEKLDEQAGTFTPEMKQNGFFSCSNEEIKSISGNVDEDGIISELDNVSISTPGPASRSSVQANRADDVPANHWILVSPRAIRERYASGSCHGDLISEDAIALDDLINQDDTSAPMIICNDKEMIAKRTIIATMARLKEILTIRELHAESRVWCREVLALRSRFWVQYDTSTSHKVGNTIRKMKRELWGS